MPSKPKDIDAILAGWPPERRQVLERLRQIIRSAAPRAEECISYQLPAFRIHGRGLVAFGGAAKHVALYPMGSGVLPAFREELRAFDCSKGTIRFPWDRPLPAMLIRRIVKARVAANAVRDAATAKRVRGTKPKSTIAKATRAAVRPAPARRRGV